MVIDFSNMTPLPYGVYDLTLQFKGGVYYVIGMLALLIAVALSMSILKERGIYRWRLADYSIQMVLLLCLLVAVSLIFTAHGVVVTTEAYGGATP